MHFASVEIGCQHVDLAHRVGVGLVGQRIVAEDAEIGRLAGGQEAGFLPAKPPPEAMGCLYWRPGNRVFSSAGSSRSIDSPTHHCGSEGS